MLRRTIGCLAIGLLATAGSALADNVYVPILGAEIDGILYETQVSVANGGTADGEFTTYFIDSGSDGTDRAGDGQSIVLLPGSTFASTYDSGFLGMLEIETDPQLIFQAQLASRAGGEEVDGAQVPFVTSSNVVNAGVTAHLLGWVRDGSRVTDFGLLNLGDDPATCLFDVFHTDGSLVFNDAVLEWPALAHRHFPDVLGSLGLTEISGVRVSAVCDQRFFPYATLVDRAAGTVAFLPPAASGLRALPPPPPGPGECAQGATCFTQEGVFHRPTRGNEIRRVLLNPPFGSYSRVNVRVTVTNGGWAGNSDGSHNIFWLVRSVNKDLLGYINVRGPNKFDVFIRHGFGQRHALKPRLSAPFGMRTGEPYHFEYAYAPSENLVELVVRDQSLVEVARTRGAPDIRNLDYSPGQQFLIEFGLAGINPAEPATYGWTYQDLFVEFVP